MKSFPHILLELGAANVRCIESLNKLADVYSTESERQPHLLTLAAELSSVGTLAWLLTLPEGYEPSSMSLPAEHGLMAFFTSALQQTKASSNGPL